MCVFQALPSGCLEAENPLSETCVKQVSGCRMGSFWRDMAALIASPILLVAWASTSVLSLVAGPFGTYTILNHGERAFYWALVIAVFALLFVGFRCAFRKVLPGLSYWQHSGIVSLSLAVVFIPAVLLISKNFSAALVAQFPPTSILFGLAFVVGFAIHVITWFVMRHPTQELRLMLRVPEELRGELLRLSVDDHYVEIYTDRGMHRVLMRLSDAKLEAEGADGFCIHRSHWVVRSAIVSARREKGRVFVRLRDGSEAPVSRTYQHRIEEGGWL